MSDKHIEIIKNIMNSLHIKNTEYNFITISELLELYSYNMNKILFALLDYKRYKLLDC